MKEPDTLGEIFARVENQLTLTDEQLQEEFNRQCLNYHWMLNQANQSL